MTMADPMISVDEKLYRLWAGGIGIGETMRAIKHTHGVDLTFEEVRAAFISCCDRFASSSARAA